MLNGPYVSFYLRDDAIVIELEDEDGFFISGASIPLIELKDALDALNAQDQPKETV
jgi:uncharacterized membrane protein